MPRFSLKSVILSNIAYWAVTAVGLTACAVVYYASATIATDGAADAKSIAEQMKSSVGLAVVGLWVAIAAALIAGYVGAKLAPQAKLTHGVLATLSCILLSLYGAIWGFGGTDSHTPVPYWMDMLVDYGTPFLALFGAYLCQRRQEPIAQTPASARYQADYKPEAQQQRPDTSASTSKNGFARSGTMIGAFISVVIGLLLTKHEQLMLLLAVVGATAILLLVGFAEKMFRSLRS